MDHAAIILELSNQDKKRASQISNGEILTCIEECESLFEFKQEFQRIINSK